MVHEQTSNSPPEPEDDYVTEELPSMAMDHHQRKDSDSGDENLHNHHFNSRPLGDMFAGGPPPEKQRRLEERDPLVFFLFFYTVIRLN